MTAALTSVTPDRPRLRGMLHAWSFFVSIATGAALIIAAAATVSGRATLGTSVYAVTVLGLFGVSATYHLRAPGSVWMKRLDHSMIFVFIAGTYTPFTLLSLDHTTGAVILTVVWVGALLGVLLKLAWPHAPRWLGVPVYLALGWVAIPVLPQLTVHAGVATLVLLLAGGLCYTLGALCYATSWPNPWPATFGHHEFFHAFTVLAALCHYLAIWLALYR